jgi:outer membrane lipoprotein
MNGSRLLVPLLALIVTGCSSPIPDLIRQAPPDNIQVEEVQQRPDDFLNSRVRWGGEIIGVENLSDSTLVEVLSRRLSSSGRPDSDSRSQGRFKITLPGFREPANFPKERLLTVTGTVVGKQDGSVGEYQYSYPLVQPDAYYLWAPEVEGPPYYPYYYDPFYSPWYYPYWYRHPHYWR